MKLKESIIILTFTIICLLSCSESERKKPISQNKFAPKKHNILLITVDTLRADHLSCYNRKLSIKTENIDSLADTGILFKAAYCQSSWTLPSMVSLFSSLYPSVHHAGEPIPETGKRARIPQKLEMLPRILKDNGYHTVAFVTNVWLSSAFWFGNHFDTFINFSNQVDASEKISKNAMLFLSQKKSSPFFLWLHYLDPHEYPNYQKIEMDKDYTGRLREKFDWKDLRLGVYRLHRRDRKHLLSRYVGNVIHTDQQIGNVLNTLKETNLYDDTLIIFSSDHGEEFWEHGRLDHGQSAYEEVLKVPLIISLPTILPKSIRISQLVELNDIAPTVFELCGINHNSPLQGKSLVQYCFDQHIPDSRLSFSENTFYGENIQSVTNSRYKLIYYTISNRYEFYDLKKDPLEQKNIFTMEDKNIKLLMKELSKWSNNNKHLSRTILKDTTLKPPLIDKQTKEALESMGYIQ